MTVLIIACALVYLVDVVRRREIVTTVIALVGLVLFILAAGGIISLPVWVSR